MPTATPRNLIAGIVIATLMTWAVVIVDLARGGRADPPELRAAATLLDGTWRFHTGDDPHWADANTNDSSWETTDMTAPRGSHDGDVGLPDYVKGWAAHGHPVYAGYAWYRRAVTVPAGHAAWDILGPTLVEDAYEIYWNGKLLGGSGRLGTNPRFVGTRPLRFALPVDASGAHGVVAVRAFMRKRSAPGPEDGGMHSAPILAPRPISDALHRVQWERTIAGYVVDAIEPLAMFALVGLVLWCWPRGNKGFLIFACIALVLTGARRLNNAITAWTDLQDLTTYALLAKFMWIPTLTAWTFAWNRWSRRPWLLVDVLAVVLTVATTLGTMHPWPSVTRDSRLGWIAVLVVIGVRIARSGPMRSLALVTLASIIAAFFGGELLDPIGVPGIWFPFGIGVSRTQYIYAIAVPLLAVLIVQMNVERSGLQHSPRQ